jgi:hypothetical protein
MFAYGSVAALLYTAFIVNGVQRDEWSNRIAATEVEAAFRMQLLKTLTSHRYHRARSPRSRRSALAEM